MAIKKRSELVETVDNFKKEHAPDFDAKSPAEVLLVIVDQMKLRVNIAFEKGEITADNKNVYLNPLRRAVSDYNDWQRVERLRELKAMDREAASEDYLASQGVDGYIVEYKDETGLELNPGRVLINVGDWFAYMFSADKAGIMDDLNILADNIRRLNDGDDTAFLSGHSMSASYIYRRKKKGWDFLAETPDKDKKLSWPNLAKQATEVAREIFGESVVPELFKIDVRTIRDGICNTKLVMKVSEKSVGLGCEERNTSGKKRTVAKETTVLAELMTAVMHRRAKVAYEYDIKLRSGNAKNAALCHDPDEAATAGTGNPEFRPSGDAEATSGVTVGKAAPKGKKAAKKADATEAATK